MIPKKKISTILKLLSFLLYISFQMQGQSPVSQQVRGHIADIDTQKPLEGAIVVLVGTVLGGVTNIEGEFSIGKVPIGEYTLQITHIGYDTLLLPEVRIDAAKEKIVDIQLKEATKKLREVTIKNARPVAFNSMQRITMEQTMRYAATFFDPARLMTSFPGVVAANDQANGLVIRGNSPNTMQWRLEGVEIVNPNHLSNAGTFSDRPTQSGGGVNILSAQLMDKTDFLTSAFPADYGNALGGILDVSLRKGNNQRHEFMAQAGLIGIDLMAEGPISKSSKASYLVNYRYSFTGLLAAMGISFGGEKISFQDLSFNLSFPTKHIGNFTVFGMGGVSSNLFEGSREVSDWKVQKDGSDIYYHNRMGAAGITHTLAVGKNTVWRTVIAASGLVSSREGYLLANPTLIRTLTQTDDAKRVRYSFSTAITHKINADWQLKVGAFITSQNDSARVFDKAWLVNGSIQGYIVQPYISVLGNLLPRLSLRAGVHYMLYTYNGASSVEPRVGLRYAIASGQAISFSYGLHSQLQLPQTYLRNNYLWGNIPQNNLRFTRANHWVVGYERFFRKQQMLKVEAYFQSIFDVPTNASDQIIDTAYPYVSLINVVEGITNYPLTNNGKGVNYGIEATYQRFLRNNFYALITGSIYQAEFGQIREVTTNSRFSGNYTFSLAGGKDFNKRPNRTFGINIRVVAAGGYRELPIDENLSKLAQHTIYKYDAANFYSIKLKDYLRPDLRIFLRKNKPNYTRIWSLDIQNVANIQNQSYHYYDTFLQKIMPQYQVGIVPVINYRVEF